jgi:hypothetical protein
MPRTERGTRWVAGTCNAWLTSATSGAAHPATESLLSTLRSKSTTTGHRPTNGKPLLTAYTQPGSVHRNPGVSSIKDDLHRGHISKGAISSNDAITMATPYRSDASGHGVPYEGSPADGGFCATLLGFRWRIAGRPMSSKEAWETV